MDISELSGFQCVPNPSLSALMTIIIVQDLFNAGTNNRKKEPKGTNTTEKFGTMNWDLGCAPERLPLISLLLDHFSQQSMVQTVL